MKLTRKGYLFIAVTILVSLVTVSVYAYVASQTVRDLVGKLTGFQSPITNNSTTPSPAPSPISSPVSSPVSSPNPNQSPLPTNQTASSDAEIKSSILQGVLKNPEWRKNELEIKVTNGAVEVKGAVNDKTQITQLDQFIRSVSGVKQVGLFLEVKPDTTTSSLVPTPLPSQVNSVEKSNELLAKEVEFACYKTDAIEIKNIKISAKDGEITLSGKVRSRAEKLLAERISKEVPGVKSVNNELEVKLN